ncbi:hypothetical protein Tco_1445532, partial [Tanacetum coccineum]
AAEVFNPCACCASYVSEFPKQSQPLKVLGALTKSSQPLVCVMVPWIANVDVSCDEGVSGGEVRVLSIELWEKFGKDARMTPQRYMFLCTTSPCGKTLGS